MGMGHAQVWGTYRGSGMNYLFLYVMGGKNNEGLIRTNSCFPICVFL